MKSKVQEIEHFMFGTQHHSCADACVKFGLHQENEYMCCGACESKYELFEDSDKCYCQKVINIKRMIPEYDLIKKIEQMTD